MNYRDVIYEEKQEEYKKMHKIMYRTLGNMIFDISFIEASVSLQDNELGHDFITISFLHRNVFENLITKMYRGFFDNSGSDTINLMKFKNKVIKEYIKEEYKQEILDDIKKLPIEDKIYKRKFEIIKKNVDIIRDKYIAHGILDPKESSKVDLKDIKELLKNGCEESVKKSL